MRGSSLTNADAGTPTRPWSGRNSVFESPPPASRAHAVAEQERSRRLVLSLSGPPPTSSDEEVGRIPLGRVPEGTRRPAVDTSDDDYYSTSSTSSGGSSTRDLEAKAALWAEYQQRPADVISRFESSAPRARLPEDGADRVAETAAAGSRAPDDNVAKHEPTCRRLRTSCKQLRLARRQTRQQQRLGRWFSAQREEEGADDGDDEGDARGVVRLGCRFLVDLDSLPS
ncbi:hypothetical protein B0H14DRAFT_2617726 [Mycena olivaceomarginata]|nr:hypothetical protein B0H14DRAFT_2617726 [Mycena olivaceomarginata]